VLMPCEPHCENDPALRRATGTTISLMAYLGEQDGIGCGAPTKRSGRHAQSYMCSFPHAVGPRPQQRHVPRGTHVAPPMLPIELDSPDHKARCERQSYRRDNADRATSRPLPSTHVPRLLHATVYVSNALGLDHVP